MFLFLHLIVKITPFKMAQKITVDVAKNYI